MDASQLYKYDSARKDLWRRAIARYAEAISLARLWLFLGYKDAVLAYRNTVIGLLWVPLAALGFSAAFSYVYTEISPLSYWDYFRYLYFGWSTWRFLQEGITFSSYCFFSNKSLMLNSSINPLVFPLRSLVRATVNYLATMLFGVAFFAITHGVYPNVFLLLSVPVMIAVMVPIAILSAYFGEFLPIYRAIVDRILSVLFFLTPIIWSTAEWSVNASATRSRLVEFNPLYHLVNLVRAPALSEAFPVKSALILLGCTVLSVILAFVVSAAGSDHIARRVR